MSLFKKKLSTENIDVSNISTRPLRINNRIITDNELVKISLDMLDEFTESTQTPPPVDTAFIQWLRDCKEYVDNGGKIKDFKEKTIQKTTLNIIK